MELTSEQLVTMFQEIETRLSAIRETCDQALERLADQLAQERSERLADRQRWEALERKWSGFTEQSADVDSPSRASLLMGW